MIKLKRVSGLVLLALGVALTLTIACSLNPQPEPPAIPASANGDPTAGAGSLGSGGEVTVDMSADGGVPALPPTPTERDGDGGLAGDAGALDAGPRALSP